MGKLALACLVGLLLVALPADAVQDVNVGLVGAGIGGGAFSYYLQKFGCLQQIEAFESRSYVGGRVNEVQFGGQLEEIGADAWSPVNFYIQQITKELGVALGESSYAGNGEVGIWSGNDLAHWKRILASNSVVDVCLSRQIKLFISALEENYAERQASGAFQSVNEFLAAGNMTHYLEQGFQEFLQSQCNASQEYLDTLVAPIVRAIYDQTMSLHSFGGQVSLLAIFTEPLWAAQGNSQLPKAMFKASNATVHLNSAVDTIRWTGDNFEIFHNNSASYTKADYMVLAAPIEKLNITFEGVQFYNSVAPREFVFCFVTLVEAAGISPVYFGKPASFVMPDSILTTPESKLPFTIIGIRNPSLTTPGAKLYKIFSNGDISGLLPQVFMNVTDSYVHKWEYTFPDLVPTDDFQPIVLAKNLLYLNTIESTVTAMEGSVIAGRNSAQLLCNWINKE